MSLDRQGKGTGEGAVERITSRPNENGRDNYSPTSKSSNEIRNKVDNILNRK